MAIAGTHYLPIIVITLHGFNDLGRSVVPIFLLMDQFLYRFSMLSEKNEENLSIRSFICKMHHRNPLFVVLRFVGL